MLCFFFFFFLVFKCFFGYRWLCWCWAIAFNYDFTFIRAFFLPSKLATLLSLNIIDCLKCVRANAFTIRSLDNLDFLTLLSALFFALCCFLVCSSIHLFKVIDWLVLLPFNILKLRVIYKMPVNFLLFLWLWFWLHFLRFREFQIPLLLLFKLFLYPSLLCLFCNSFNIWFFLVNFAKSRKFFLICCFLKNRSSWKWLSFALFNLTWVLIPTIGRKITLLHRLLWLACLKALSLTETYLFIAFVAPESNIEFGLSQFLVHHHVVLT